MTVYTYNGSIPTEIPPGVSEEDYVASGWKIAPDKPECPEGKEVVWWSYYWVIRDPKPDDYEGYQWSWNQDNQEWLNHLYIYTGNTENTIWMAEATATLNVSTNTLIYMVTGVNPEANTSNTV